MKILELLTEKRKIGNVGERAAAKLLKKSGYKILERNYVALGYEIDIIASDSEYIAFVEVKLRKNDDFAMAREFVTASKQRRILSTARLWLAEHPLCELQPRFDIVEIYAPKGRFGPIEVNHIENAFM